MGKGENYVGESVVLIDGKRWELSRGKNENDQELGGGQI